MIGFYSDRVGRINVAALGTLIAALAAFFLWIFAGEHYAGAVVYSLLGAFTGCIWACVAPVAAEIIGLQLLPSGKPNGRGRGPFTTTPQDYAPRWTASICSVPSRVAVSRVEC